MKRKNVPFIQPELLMKARHRKRSSVKTRSTNKNTNSSMVDLMDEPIPLLAQRDGAKITIRERLTGPTRSQVELQHKENMRMQARLQLAKSKVDTSSPQQYPHVHSVRHRKQARASYKKLNQSVDSGHGIIPSSSYRIGAQS